MLENTAKVDQLWVRNVSLRLDVSANELDGDVTQADGNTVEDMKKEHAYHLDQAIGKIWSHHQMRASLYESPLHISTSMKLDSNTVLVAMCPAIGLSFFRGGEQKLSRTAILFLPVKRNLA